MPKVLEQMAQIFLETLQHAQRHVSSSFGASAGVFFLTLWYSTKKSFFVGHCEPFI
jgi:hypothetical protein